MCCCIRSIFDYLPTTHEDNRAIFVIVCQYISIIDTHGWWLFYPTVDCCTRTPWLIVVYIWHTHALPIATVNIYCTLQSATNSIDCCNPPSPFRTPSPVTILISHTLHLSNSQKPLDAFIDLLPTICIIMQLPSILMHLRSARINNIVLHRFIATISYYLTGRSAPSAPLSTATPFIIILLYPPAIVANVYCLLLRVWLSIPIRVRNYCAWLVVRL